ncbi:FAD/FMN-containing dehydrogenase [Nitrobacteraceae bacterium AZCC 2146]
MPAGLIGPRSRTLLRIEGIRASVDHRLKELQTLLAGRGLFEPFDATSSAKAWLDVRDVKYFAQPADEAVWRISVKPTDGPRFIQSLQAKNMRYFYDWSGGLVWLAVPGMGDAAASAIRAGTSRLGGHATLVRAPNSLRNVVPVFEPLAEPLMKITAGIKRSVDPSRILNPAVMYAGI